MASFVRRMLELHKKLPKTKDRQARTLIERDIAATDRRIDLLFYELYGLTHLGRIRGRIRGRPPIPPLSRRAGAIRPAFPPHLRDGQTRVGFRTRRGKVQPQRAQRTQGGRRALRRKASP